MCVWICQHRPSCLGEWCLTKTHITTLGSQLVALFKEAVEPLGGAALLPVCTLSLLCFLCIDERCKLPASCSCHQLLCLPLPQWTLTLETTASQNKLFLRSADHGLGLLSQQQEQNGYQTKMKQANKSAHISTNKEMNKFTQHTIIQQGK